MFVQDKNFDFVEISDSEVGKIIERKNVIALDFDGVITDPYKLKTAYLNERGHEIKEEQCSTISCLNLGIPKEDNDYATEMAFTTSPDKLPLVRDFLRYFTEIRKLKNLIIVVITSRPKNMRQHLEDYLRYHKIKIDGVIFTNKKSKTLHLEKINARFFVEDSPFKIWQVIKENPQFGEKCTFILFRNVQNSLEKKPWNKVIEVDSWKELIGIIKSSS